MRYLSIAAVILIGIGLIVPMLLVVRSTDDDEPMAHFEDYVPLSRWSISKHHTDRELAENLINLLTEVLLPDETLTPESDTNHLRNRSDNAPEQARPSYTEDGLYRRLQQAARRLERDLTFKRLNDGQLAFNRPKRMIYHESSKIQLVVSSVPLEQSARGFLSDQLEGDIREAEVKVARYISAQLRGATSEFEISPAGAQLRDMSGPRPASWTWDITPLSYGTSKRLTVEVTGHLEAQNSVSAPYELRTFVESFDVDIGIWDWLLFQLARVQPVWTVPAAVLGGSWAVFLFLRQLRTGPDQRLPRASSDRRRSGRVKWTRKDT
jgi:hypothetical protein